jgi:tetratricopeptide (TPR) repeat protein
MMTRLSIVLIMLAVLGAAARAGRAVVVEDVEPRGAADCGGVLIGDRLVGWTSETRGLTGAFVTPWDVELATREVAVVDWARLTVERGGEVLQLLLAPYPWGLTPGYAGEPPCEPDDDLAPAESCRRRAAELEQRGEPLVAAWLLLRRAAVPGNDDGSDALFSDALRIAESTGRHEIAAIVLEDWAASLRQRNLLGETIRRLEEAVAHWEQREPDSVAVAGALSQLARELAVQGRVGEAVEVADRSMEIAGASAPGTWLAAEAMAGRALTAGGEGNVEWMYALFRDELAIVERLAPGTIKHVKVQSDVGAAAQVLGHTGEAEQRYKTALAELEAIHPGHLVSANLVGNLGLLCWARSELAEAEQYCRRQLEILRQGAPGSLVEAGARKNLGNIRVMRGDPFEAESLYLESLDLYRRLAPASDRLPGAYFNVGIARAVMGDPIGAEAMFRKGLELTRAREIVSWRGEASGLENLAASAASRGEWELAVAYRREVYALVHEHEPGDVLEARAQCDLASDEAQIGRLRPAWPLIQEAIATMREKSPAHHQMPNILATGAKIAFGLGELKQARELCEEAIAFLRQNRIWSLSLPSLLSDAVDIALAADDLEAAKGWVEEGFGYLAALPESVPRALDPYVSAAKVALREGRRDEAISHLFRAIELAEAERVGRTGAPERGFGLSGSRIDVFHRLIALLVSAGREEEAFEVLERSRARSLRDLWAARDLDARFVLPVELDRRRRSLEADHDRLLGELADLGPESPPERRIELEDRLHRLRDDRLALLEEAGGWSPLPAPSPQHRSAFEVRDALPPGTVLLSYAVLDSGVLLFVMPPSSTSGPAAKVYDLGIDPAELEQAVVAFRELVLSGEQRAIEVLREGGASLYDLLLGPAEAEIAGARRLLISADGPLHLLPFAALVRRGPVSAEDRFVVEWKPVTLVTSATAHSQQAARRRDHRQARVVAFGNPERHDAGSGSEELEPQLTHVLSLGAGLAQLPATADEVAAVAAQWGDDVQAYAGVAATEELVKALAPEATILHLACHGWIDPQLPLESGLLMATPSDGATDNGLLQAWEVMEQLRLDADLVVLSACDTALGAEARPVRGPWWPPCGMSRTRPRPS